MAQRSGTRTHNNNSSLDEKLQKKHRFVYPVTHKDSLLTRIYGYFASQLITK